jgi:DNA-binding MarR family transcriptional regulator
VDKYDLSNVTTYQAGVAQASMHRLLQKYCDDILRPFGITKMHWLIIGAILESDAKGARISDLATELSTTIPYLTNTINLLESKDILVRSNNADDSRSKLIRVAPSFEPKCAEIEITLREGLRKTIYSEIEPEDFRTYIRVLYQLSKVAEHPKK